MGAELRSQVEDEQAVQETLATTHTTISISPLTQSQFLSWKRQKDADASARQAEAARKREEDIRAGIVPMNGRELFLHEPGVFDNNIY